MARDGRRLGRWDDDRRTPRPRRFVDGDRVIGGVSGDAHERALDGGEQIEGGGRIIPRRLGQRVDTDHAGLIDVKVELPPATPAAATVFRGRPLTGPDDGQTRAVEHEMEARAGRDQSQTAPQMLTAPGERRIVGGGEVEAHHPEQGVQESFGLAQREMVEESQGQGGLDGEIRVAPLPAPLAAPAGRPGSDRFRGHPHRHIAASNEGLIVGRPVRHAVLRLIRGMNLRLHPRSVAPAEGPEKGGPRHPTRSGYSCNNAITPREVADLVVRMAVENPPWGYTRIRGALANLGHDIARNTVKRILHDHGIEPAPERARRTPWKAFLQAHWDGLAACDLVTVEVLTLAGLKRYLVFFVIELKTRRVTIAGIHPQPYGAWMEQLARNLTDPVEGCLRTASPLIHDRDPLYTRVFGEILMGGGVQPIRLPPKSPNLNAYAERFVRSIKEECLSRVVPLGEAHVRQLVHEFVEHYHHERNHQGRDNQLLQRPPPPVNPDADVERRERLGGLLSCYYREAARGGG